MRVRIYRNLNKKTFSILKKTKGGWRIHGYTNDALLYNVRFVVYQRGRERVLKQRRKNVHAFIEGEYLPERVSTPIPSICTTPVSYNPYYAGYFYDKTDNSPVNHATYASLKYGDSIFISSF